MYSSDTNLSQIKPGIPARIREIGGGHGLRQKLNLMGISEGSVVRVISNSSGPVTGVIPADATSRSHEKSLARVP